MDRSAWRRILVVGSVALGLLLVTALTWSLSEGAPVAPQDSAPVADEGSVLMRLRPGADLASLERRLTDLGLVVGRRIPHIDVWQVAAPREGSLAAERPQEIARQLAAQPEVLWAEPNGRVQAVGIHPNDTFYQAQQAHLRLIGLPEAWVLTQGSTGTIAILDTGISFVHPDLNDKLWTNSGEIAGNGADDDLNGYVDDLHGWNFVAGSADSADDHSHGSHVAGIAAAETNNGAGIAGVSWGATVMPVKVLNNLGDGSWADVAEGVIYAADNGAQVLNLSLSGDEYTQTIGAAVDHALAQGCLIVAAAGNSGSQPTPVGFPAALPGVLAVGATTAEDAPWANSNRGPELDVAAPGVDIFSANKSTSYYMDTGTSMATAHVSGLGSLIWSLDPGLSAAEVAQVITSTAVDVHSYGWDDRTGWGRVDAKAAAMAVAQPTVTVQVSPGSIHVGSGSAVVTATVTLSQGALVSDGLEVTLEASMGTVSPTAGLTQQGQVTGTFSSPMFGEATLTARIGVGYQGAAAVWVEPYRFFLPAVFRQN